MKVRLTYRFLTIILWAGILFFRPNTILNQQFPVQSTVQIAPPYSVYLNDYADPVTEKLTALLMVHDITQSNLQVKLRITILGDGIELTTNPAYNPPPIILQGGEMKKIAGADLKGYLDPVNMIFKGLNKSAFIQNSKLPEGIYRFMIEVVEYRRGVKISNSGSAMAWLILNDPPHWVLPEKNAVLEATNPQKIFFNWMAVHKSGPNSAFNTEYEFTLTEIWPLTRDPQEAIRTTIPLYQTTTSATSFYYGPQEPMLEPGRRYAVRIRAFDKDGRDMFKNDGYSEVLAFTFGEKCEIPFNVATGNGTPFEQTVSWNGLPGHSAYEVRYREITDDGTSEWYMNNTSDEQATLKGLKAGFTYEYQVKGMCGSISGEYSDELTFTTSSPQPKTIECGTGEGVTQIDNSGPLAMLKKGDKINVGGFEAEVTEVSGSNGTFSGKCIVFVRNFGVRVFSEFENISVNESYQVTDGEIISVRNELTLVNTDAVIGAVAEGINTLQENLTTETEITENSANEDYIYDTLVTIEDDITEVITNEEGTVSIVTESGDTIAVNNEKDVFVQDESGNGYYISTGGGVITFEGGTSGGAIPDNVKPATDSTLINYPMLAKFSPEGMQLFGFDQYKHEQLISTYTKTTVDDTEYVVSWKSVASGQTDKVEVTVDIEDASAKEKKNILKSLVFRDETGMTIPHLPTEKENVFTLTLTGQSHKDTRRIDVIYKFGDKEKIIGTINTISFDKQRIKVKVIPVNGNDYFNGNAASIQQKLNAIYKSAVTDWEVTYIAEGISMEEWDADYAFNDGESEFLSSYTDDMDALIDATKERYGLDDDTYYIFLLKKSRSGSIKGRMPIKSQFGFIFTDKHSGADQAAYTIAHEMGHGAFRLYHPFSSKSKYILPQNSTTNLMDYANGEDLFKYQWDLIHDPQTMLFAFMQDESDGALILPDAETIALLKERLYDKVFKEKYSVKDLWTEEEKLKIIKEINGQVLKLFYIKNESGEFKWDYPRFYSDKGIDQSTFDPKTASEELRKEHELEYSLANYIIKNYSDLLLKPVSTYQASFNVFSKYFYDTEKSELGTNIFNYPWIGGRTGEMIDPRNYYADGAYDFTRLENDAKEFVLLKEEKYVNPANDEVDAAKLMRLNTILSMYGEYMYLKGSSEIPGITVDGINAIKASFYDFWEETETEQWGFYWTWKALNQERLEQERQRYLALLQGQQALEAYIEMLEDGKFQAVLEIAGGGLSVGGTVAVFIFFPPANAGGWVLGSASIGFSVDQIAGGVSKLSAIKNGMFDPTKEYKPVKGVIMGMAGEYGEQVGFAYDITSILVGFASGTGEAIQSVNLLKSIKGNEIEAIIRGYAAGSEYVNVGINTYYLKK